MSKKVFKIEGMHCASCSSIITKKLSGIDGIREINVNFANEKASIDFDDGKVNIDIMNNEIEKLGYTIHNTNEDIDLKEISSIKNKESKFSKQKIKTQISFSLALIIFTIMMLEILVKVFPQIPTLPMQSGLINNILMIVSTFVMFWVGQPFVSGVGKFIRYRVANMDTLVGLGTLTAYVYSVAITLFPQIQVLLNLPKYNYFDAVIVVIGFITFGKYLEANSKKRTGEAIEKLMGLQAKTAIIIRGGAEIEIFINEVKIGDIIIVKPGMKIPVDGQIIQGTTSIDESMITGESIPVDKKNGDIVIGSTINKQGSFRFEATKIGKETMLAQIIKMVEEAQGSRAPIQAMADKISSIFVPIVLIIAFLSIIMWLLIGIPTIGQQQAISYGILSFVSVLVIACPCALGLATPTAVIVGVGLGAKYGILIKNAESLELLSKVDVIVLDKTGTITKGKPEVTDVISLDKSFKEEEILQITSSVEKLSEHPLAQSIANHAISKGTKMLEVSNFTSLEGIGVQAIVNDKKISIHKPEAGIENKEIKNLQEEGKTVIEIEVENKIIGLIALSDTIKEGAVEAIEKLHNKGIKVIMITGDNHLAAQNIAKQVNIDEVISEVLPSEKTKKIKELQTEGRIVAMAGDGINDAPALVEANVGIAMATGSDIAIESAGIAILHGDIHKISQAIDLSKATMRTIKQNLFWAFIYNIVGIPLAAGLLYPIWGIVLNPIFAGLAMALSSISVVGNSLLLKNKKI